MKSRAWSGDRAISRGFSLTHNGIDVAMPIGTKLFAVQAGKILRGVDQYGGLWISVRNGSKDDLYVHVDRFVVKDGQTVKPGQLIAYSGNTGRSSGPHLHFTRRILGVPVNPYKYLLTAGGEPMATKQQVDFMYETLLLRKRGVLEGKNWEKMDLWSALKGIGQSSEAGKKRADALNAGKKLDEIRKVVSK